MVENDNYILYDKKFIENCILEIENFLFLNNKKFTEINELNPSLQELCNFLKKYILDHDFFLNISSINDIDSSISGNIKEIIKRIRYLQKITYNTNSSKDVQHEEELKNLQQLIKATNNILLRFQLLSLKAVEMQSIEYKNFYDALSAVSKLNASYDNFKNNLAILNSNYESALEDLKLLNKGIQETALSKHFSYESEKLKESASSWLRCSILLFIFLIAFSIWFFDTRNYIASENLVPSIIYRFPIFIILGAALFFCLKQYSNIIKASHEYEYKYVLSLSYFNYKNEVSELKDSDTSPILLYLMLNSIVSNPLNNKLHEQNSNDSNIKQLLEILCKKIPPN